MNLKKIFKFILITIAILLIIFSYYYLPSQNKGSIKIESKELESIPNINNILDPEKKINNSQNIFTNTEYTSQSKNGEIITTKAKQSYILQDNTDLIYLIEPYSFTKLSKDQSLIEINSLKGLYDKKNQTVSYENDVKIKNKNYLITSKKAIHYSSKNIIIISENVVMKDLTQGLSHVMYCDIVEIDTITNNATAYMKSKNKKVTAKKFK